MLCSYCILKFNHFKEFNRNKTSREIYARCEVIEKTTFTAQLVAGLNKRGDHGSAPRPPPPPQAAFRASLAQGAGSLSRPWAPSHTQLRSLTPGPESPPRSHGGGSGTASPRVRTGHSSRPRSPAGAAAAPGSGGTGDGA